MRPPRSPCSPSSVLFPRSPCSLSSVCSPESPRSLRSVISLRSPCCIPSPVRSLQRPPQSLNLESPTSTPHSTTSVLFPRSPRSLSSVCSPESPRSLSPGFGARQQRSRACSGGSRPVLKSGHPPRRRPLPSVSSLGPPPAKPPLPPGPRDIQSFWRTSAASTASAGLHFQARQPKDIPPDPDEAYELYDDVEPTADSSPSPKGREAVLSTQQPLWRPPQDPEPRKEKAPQPQQLPPTDLKSLRQIRKAEKAEREFRKKFKFEGEIVIQTRMMIDPNAKTRRGGGKHLGIRRGEILEVIEFTNKEEMLCRDTKGKYGYVPRTALLPLETEVYDDVASWDPLDNQPFPGGR
ncbi:PML-RARA-regulated adapter molecule 1 isoform X9 [Hippopotamus amphibius kiboko]|uniref:PML-RARA-regulated adapter molecule 1 isoform X9 n=1 Tax=Hippopotamus amphibius kiboko TaxID=575201 RepID=UPI002591E2BF|nr:PML-RARA-regulated adapter molecule 1 isoform X9 [Hippopotamus amphibius kiboko]